MSAHQDTFLMAGNSKMRMSLFHQKRLPDWTSSGWLPAIINMRDLLPEGQSMQTKSSNFLTRCLGVLKRRPLSSWTMQRFIAMPRSRAWEKSGSQEDCFSFICLHILRSSISQKLFGVFSKESGYDQWTIRLRTRYSTAQTELWRLSVIVFSWIIQNVHNYFWSLTYL